MFSLKKISKKISVIIVISILALNLSFFSAPERANAILGLGDITFSFDGANFSEMLSEWGSKIVDFSLESAAKSIAKRLINQITAATVDWIKGGGKGQPAYVADTSKFLFGKGGLTDQVIGDAINNDIRMCSAFMKINDRQLCYCRKKSIGTYLSVIR